MNLNEFYDEVARKADTEKMKISAAETKHVLAEAFKVLAALDAATVVEVLGKALTTAKKKLSK